MDGQPTGTVTLLFTDIEGSTRLLEQLGTAGYGEALELHRRLLREAFERHGGYEVDCEGDAFFVAFASAKEAVAAAEEAQQALAAATWPSGGTIRVRMGLHTGEPLAAPPKYVGIDVHKAARIMAAGHGGQVLLSEATRRLAGEAAVTPLGEHRLKDLLQPETLYQLQIDGLRSEFPMLRTAGNLPRNRLDFRLLGPLETRLDGEPVELGGMQRRAILAILLLHAGHVVSVDHLIDDLWGEKPPATAAHIIQVHVSQLRKLFGPAEEVLATQRPGYVIRIEPDQLDLSRFERLLADGREALGRRDAETAAAVLHDALDLWQGPALADFAFEPFAEAAIARLEDLRLAALEDRIEADLKLGRHQAVVGELEELIAGHPLRERLRAHLMLALYRAGRQAEALEAYHATRRALVEELGIEPGVRLQELERAILNQDPALDEDPGKAPSKLEALAAPERSVLLVSRGALDMDDLLRLSEPLARSQRPHEVILARVVDDAADLEAATTELAGRRAELADRRVASRVAAFTSSDPATDLVRLASQQEVDLLLVDGRPLASGALEGELRTILDEAPSDVASSPARVRPDSDGAVIVPFGAAEHDWAALELGVWMATARRVRLRLLGAAAGPAGERGDASRVLASASLVVQQLAGIIAEPMLVSGTDGILAAANDAGVVLLGLSERWRHEGIGDGPVGDRCTVARARPPRPPRPPARRPDCPWGLTRYTWSFAPPAENAEPTP